MKPSIGTGILVVDYSKPENSDSNLIGNVLLKFLEY
jgi:hypothetical protein